MHDHSANQPECIADISCSKRFTFCCSNHACTSGCTHARTDGCADICAHVVTFGPPNGGAVGTTNSGSN